jgi:hypothetical protein
VNARSRDFSIIRSSAPFLDKIHHVRLTHRLGRIPEDHSDIVLVEMHEERGGGMWKQVRQKNKNDKLWILSFSSIFYVSVLKRTFLYLTLRILI